MFSNGTGRKLQNLYVQDTAYGFGISARCFLKINGLDNVGVSSEVVLHGLMQSICHHNNLLGQLCANAEQTRPWLTYRDQCHWETPKLVLAVVLASAD